MFGRKKKGSMKLTAKDLVSISQDDLYVLFTEEKWNNLTSESRLAILQEMENRRAAADGRRPAQVCIGDKEDFDEPGSLGFYADQAQEIHLNYRYFSDESPLHSGAGALSVLLHEGRHAFQHFRVQSGITDQSAEILKEWLSSEKYYLSPDASELGMALYGLQSIEDDARRFSRRELQRIIHNLMLRGINCRSFVREYQEALQEEHRLILLIRSSLTIETLNKHENMILLTISKMYPKLNLRNLRLFDNARLILQAKLDHFDDLTNLLDQLDKLADEKLNKIQEERLNRIMR